MVKVWCKLYIMINSFETAKVLLQNMNKNEQLHIYEKKH